MQATLHRNSRAYRRFWSVQRAAVVARDGGRCLLCGRADNLSVHHIKPWRISQDDSPRNLVTLCRPHHDAIEGVAWYVVWACGAALVRFCRLFPPPVLERLRVR